MLQQILRDMFIAPELLSELDDEQKQTLFFKMRQEQLRRWREREEKLIGVKEKIKDSLKTSKTVDFLLGQDGKPWTWVVEDEVDESSVEKKAETNIVNKEHKKPFESNQEPYISPKPLPSKLLDSKLHATTHVEPKSIPLDAKIPTENISKPDNIPPRPEPPIKNIDTAKTEGLTKAPLLQPASSTASKLPANQINKEPSRYIDAFPKSSSLKETNSSKAKSEHANVKANTSCPIVSGQMALADADILRGTGMKRKEVVQTGQEPRTNLEEVKTDGKEIFKHWMEQESKAKKMDEDRRLMAKRIREDNARLNRKLRTESQIIGFINHMVITEPFDADSSAISTRPANPSSMADVVKWYLDEEKIKGSLFDVKANQYYSYFHGTINRESAESILTDQSEGSFLLRLSDKIWGYALSYKGAHKIRHYLVDAVNQGGYQFFGYNHPPHSSLNDLIQHYKTKPLSVLLPEKLLKGVDRKHELVLTAKSSDNKLNSTEI